MNLNDRLEPVVERDDCLFKEVISKHDANVREILFQSPYPMTGRAVFMFYVKSSFLKNAVLSLCKDEDNYSTKIVYRSYIEHFLRHRYLLFRFIKEKTDDPGKDYYYYAMFEEGIRFLYGVSKSNQINGGKTSKIDLSDDIDELLKRPEYNGISREEAFKKASQFEYKQILSYLRQATSSLKVPEIPFFRWLVADYSELSSYVHGGPWAEDYLNRQSLDDELVGNLVSTANKAFNLHCALAAATFFLAKLIKPGYTDFKEVFKSYLL